MKCMFVRLTTITVVLLLFTFWLVPSSALAVEAESVSAIKVGSSLPNFSQAGGKVSRAMCFIVGLILIGAGILKRFEKRKESGNQDFIKVLSRTSLGARASLLLVEVEEQRFLLSQSGEEVRFLRDVATELNSKPEGGLSNLSLASND